ncbi:hypothetical protein HDV06_002342 [Boothiomyces sp. JEL0866]|nr:hypothetical protein HDV06_002342 [Boothiomyces sp. JEL0866]
MQKLPFTIAECTGNDPEYPPEDLLINNHNPLATGWQSQRFVKFDYRFCNFPQQITFKLTNSSRISKIQLLIHHYKIPTKLEVAVGFVSLGDNQVNGFKARELKTIHIDTVAQFVQITFHKCWINSLNLYNQVGLVAINILGHPAEIKADIEPVLYGLSMPDITKDLKYVDHDKYVINAITLISKEKNLAVQEENYSLAKTMKSLQEEFSKVATNISHLSNEKRTAIAVEDYDRAESLQFEIQNKKNFVVSKLQEHGYRIDLQESRLHKTKRTSLNKISPQLNRDSSMIRETSAGSNLSESFALKDSAERPQSAKDPNTPNELSDEDMQKYALAISVFGQKTVGCILSPYFNLREKGISDIKNELQTDLGSNPETICKATFQILNFFGTDIREKANSLFCELYKTLLEFCKENQVKAQVVIPPISEGFANLLNKIGDLNPRIKERSLELVVTICDFYHTAPNTVLPLIVKQFNATKIQSIPWKHIKTRLDLTAQMIKEYGMSETGPNNSGLNMNNVTSFAVQFLDHTNAQVRESAFAVLSEISLCEGQQAVLERIPNLSPAQIQNLQKKLPNETRPTTAIKTTNSSHVNLKPQAVAHSSEFSIKELEKNSDNPINDRQQVSSKEKLKNDKEKSKGLFSFFGQKEDAKAASTTSTPPSEIDLAYFENNCVFCGLYNPTFNEESLDQHYWNECTMCTFCPYCSLLVEVIDLETHLLQDCESSSTQVRCQNCKAIVLKSQMKSHSTSSRCKPLKKGAVRCPLCYQDFKGTDALKSHLTCRPGCLASNRKGFVN